MTDVIICGIGGMMGKAVYDSANEAGGLNVVCGVDAGALKISGLNCPVYESFDKVTEKAAVIIDFSRPAALDSILNFAKKNKCGVVFATTGYNVEELEKIKSAAEVIPVFQSANFSLGVNLLAELCRRAAHVLGEAYDIEIIEKHHRLKADSPSGTALMLADEINTSFECDKDYLFGRHGTHLSRGSEIGIHAVRGGTIVGEHDVIFTSNDETITLSHSAQSKKLFAAGAVKAAVYLKDKPEGVYRMKDLLQSII